MVIRSPETTASSPGRNHGRGQEAAQDAASDERRARLALQRDPGDLVKSGPHRGTGTNLSSSTTLPEKQKVQETREMAVKKQHGKNRSGRTAWFSRTHDAKAAAVRGWKTPPKRADLILQL